MTDPVINLCYRSDALGNWKWYAIAEIDENLTMVESGETPIDAMSLLATRISTVLQRNREVQRRKQAEARLRESR